MKAKKLIWVGALSAIAAAAGFAFAKFLLKKQSGQGLESDVLEGVDLDLSQDND